MFDLKLTLNHCRKLNRKMVLWFLLQGKRWQSYHMTDYRATMYQSVSEVRSWLWLVDYFNKNCCCLKLYSIQSHTAHLSAIAKHFNWTFLSIMWFYLDFQFSSGQCSKEKWAKAHFLLKHFPHSVVIFIILT